MKKTLNVLNVIILFVFLTSFAGTTRNDVPVSPTPGCYPSTTYDIVWQDGVTGWGGYLDNVCGIAYQFGGRPDWYTWFPSSVGLTTFEADHRWVSQEIRQDYFMISITGDEFTRAVVYIASSPLPDASRIMPTPRPTIGPPLPPPTPTPPVPNFKLFIPIAKNGG